ncbi:MAG: 50S ribosomal protein L15 [Geminicoccaceae bacterium]|nr:50S ribosomal protein L15 [Geminicoccaceae bacterium]
MKLNELRDRPGARKAAKRIGRGIGSGTGKTSGKGHKGQKARSGGAARYFEGGQMPIYRRLPKRGFKNPFRAEYAEVNLDRLQEAVTAGRLSADGTIDAARMVEAGLIRRVRDGVRLLGRGEVTQALTIEVAGASASAISAIEKAGGRVVLPAGEGTPATAEG